MVEIVVVVDKSGSMESKRNDVIGGFNAFLESQKKIGGMASLTLAFFDTGYKVFHERVPLNSAANLTRESYVPGGGTALLDAIGMTIERLESNPYWVRPERTVFVIITDGEENSSRRFNNAAIREMIKARECRGNWETIYLGANQDSFAVADQMGFKQANTANWNAQTSDGLLKAFEGVSTLTGSYRAGMTANEVVSSGTLWRPDDADQSAGNSFFDLKPGVSTPSDSNRD